MLEECLGDPKTLPELPCHAACGCIEILQLVWHNGKEKLKNRIKTELETLAHRLRVWGRFQCKLVAVGPKLEPRECVSGSDK